MNTHVTVTYAIPMERTWSGAKAARRSDPRRFNLTLFALNLSTWAYTAIATAGAIGS